MLVNQTRPPDRILIVDASSDETPRIIREFAEGTTVSIDCYEQSSRGRGVGAARQDIYERFTGDLLACLDTNRHVADNWIERQVAFHRANPEYDVLSATYLSSWDQQVDSPKSGFFFQQANCSIKREALDRVEGWDPWLPRGEDWDMQIRLWLSGAKAYAKSSLHGDEIAETEESTLNKALGRPSSVAFLRKYGWWYARFHPEHPTGDAASVFSVLALLATPLLLLSVPVLGVLSLLTVVALTVVFIYMKAIRYRSTFELRARDFRLAPRFFVLGYTALREFRSGDFSWNYGGMNDGDERDGASPGPQR
ncbi:hypothetical protein GCM10009021_26690 [Halarchaeum nitratireducens]|uniref:Glycosyltransferase 2-like domain-containing protein n=2 Tax=Halarchaeum nitratireducens TaxID=489913 RepID=A0A830GFZ9_9EURY|nr:hypothetical protein GCM10009021_26690 [Halarchaeum nitratireducens]